MTGKTYHQRLQNDLVHWVKMGWVRPEHTGAILADAARSAPPGRLPMIIGILGAILLAAGVVLFVSANWQEMTKLVRLGLLLGAMWFTFAVAVWLNRTSHKYLLEAVVFLGAVIFGANIVLIAQIYHIDNHYPDGFAFWAAGALLVTLLLQSRAALVLAFGLIVWWTGAEILEFRQNPFWPFLPVWAIAAIATYWLSFRFGLHLAFLSFTAWLIVSLEKLVKLTGLRDEEIGGIFVLFLLILFIYGLIMERKNSPLSLNFGGALARYGMIGFLLMTFATQAIPIAHIDRPEFIPLVLLVIFAVAVIFGTIILLWQKIFSVADFVLFLCFASWFTLIWFIPLLTNVWLVAVAILSLTIWLLVLAQKRDDKLLVAIALIAFGAEVLYVYIETLGTLLDTSVFFLLGGVLLITLSFGLEMLRRYLESDRTTQKVAS